MSRNSKQYDLEKRTFNFAKDVIDLVDDVSKSLVNLEIGKQLVRAAGSVGANYIEANASLSKKDFIMRIKICRKESKESRYWLNLLKYRDGMDGRRDALIQKATELLKIFGAILEKSK